MRPKITYSDGKPKMMQWGAPGPEDADLDPDRAAFIARWRGRYQRFLDPRTNPSSQSIKATLRALIKEPDGALVAAVRALDRATTAELKRAALVAYRRSDPDGRPAPEDMALRTVDAHEQRLVASPGLRDYARLALKTFPKLTSNQRVMCGMDHLFACALVRRWNADHPAQPAAVANPASEPTAFQVEAEDMFIRAGRRSNRQAGGSLKETTLASILSKAIRAERGD